MELKSRDVRRLALTASGLRRPRPKGPAGLGALRRVAGELGVLQIDSVNVFARAHYLPPWSRLGGYPRERLDALAYRDHELFEYWGHEASLLPVELHPLFRWRMARAAQGLGTWSGVARLAREQPEYISSVLAEVAASGPLTVADLVSAGDRPSGQWGWNWRAGKVALEWLFWTGAVTCSGRRNFTRLYDLPERVLPRAVLEAPTPSEAAAQRALVLRAARALGVATAGDLGDYYRIKAPEAHARVGELVTSGRLVEVAVAGWRSPGYLLPDTVVPGPVRASALLCPFDPLVWERSRVRRIFGFDYRVEIYVPAPRRVHGYYVLPFLLGEQLAARVDLKTDRAAGVLRVRAAWLEPSAAAEPTATALAAELRGVAGWLGCGSVDVEPCGDLATALGQAIG